MIKETLVMMIIATAGDYKGGVTASVQPLSYCNSVKNHYIKGYDRSGRPQFKWVSTVGRYRVECIILPNKKQAK